MLPTVILPGYFAGAIEYQEMAAHLSGLGYPTVVVPLQKKDWWPTVGGRSMVPILRRLHATVQGVCSQYQAKQVNLIGHSAGGWISRIYLGEVPYTIHGDVDETAGLWGASAQVAALVSLGTPHTSLEPWTKRNLNFVNHNYPGAFYSGVKYVCVAGKAAFGDRGWGNWLTRNSYQITCGRADTWGDGITPIEAAHLTGAVNLVLPGVYHAPRGDRTWYGSTQIIPQWSDYLR
jgi:triacylglycerol esterase/lipase EstA (alpha/beta hydrolase family)